MPVVQPPRFVPPVKPDNLDPLRRVPDGLARASVPVIGSCTHSTDSGASQPRPSSAPPALSPPPPFPSLPTLGSGGRTEQRSRELRRPRAAAGPTTELPARCHAQRGHPSAAPSPQTEVPAASPEAGVSVPVGQSAPQALPPPYQLSSPVTVGLCGSTLFALRWS